MRLATAASASTYQADMANPTLFNSSNPRILEASTHLGLQPLDVGSRLRRHLQREAVQLT